MKRSRLTAAMMVAQVVFGSVCVSAADRSLSATALAADRVNSLLLAIASGRIPPASADDGFRAYDATAKKDIHFSKPQVVESAGKVTCDCHGDGLRLHAEFHVQGEYVLVKGELENLRHDERGVMLDYRIARWSSDATFSNELQQRIALGAAKKEVEGNVFPIAAMCGKDSGVAVAIPPAEPRIFGMVGDAKGMAVRFYLGLSPETKNFPNRASFVFMLYGVEPAWGFRSALSKYYGFFPDYYNPRLKQDGLFMFQMEDRLPPNIDQYGFNLVESQWKPRALTAAIARDEKQGLATFPYMIVGQREIKFLPTLPSSYDEAMAVFARWTIAGHAGHELTKENAASQGDIHLKEEIESSACKNAEGKYCLVIRNTPWGDNSISFKINPNPDLFKDQHRPTVASYAFELMDRWLKEHPEYDGMFVDSLGANWPAVLNYRKDHFAYARYPLTFDPEGKVALYNELSHYEYVDTLRTKMRATDRLVLANGVYAYKSHAGEKKKIERQEINKKLSEFTAQGAPPEHYRIGAKLGRFFCAALLDVASSEAGVLATVDRCQDVRAFMGRKHYAFLNYAWEDGAKVEEFVNKSLCYGIFASTSTNFFSGVHYEDHPNGYLRDKKLLDWYVPLVRRLSQAGWEPIRYGTVDNEKISCERFGHGDTIYYTLYNDSTTKANCTLQLDLKSLGFSASNVYFSEIARRTPLSRSEIDCLRLELEPKRTYIIQIAKEDGR